MIKIVPLNTDDENFVSLIAKLNQYAKRSGITPEDIWRNPQEKRWIYQIYRGLFFCRKT